MSAPAVIHVGDIVPRPRWLAAWERHRHGGAHWLVECVAEFMGVFLYCYGGVGSTASLVVGQLSGQPFLGSLLQVGLGYAIGIVLALTICASTSGGHFNPCVTIVFAIYKGFPWRKVPRYIVAQILGAYVACLIIYLQWKTNIVAVEEALDAVGKLAPIQFTPNGPAGIFAFYPLPGANLGIVFANEFFVDFFLGLAVWACLDPANFLAPPASATWIIAMAYAAAIWGYAPNALAANSARDIGGRLAAMTIYGTVAKGGSYGAISALTNIISMFIAATFYEVFFVDSSRVLPPAQRDYLFGHKAHLDHVADRYGGSGHSAASNYSHDEEKKLDSPVAA